MLMELPHAILTTLLSHLPARGIAKVRCTARNADFRTILLRGMLHARCTTRIQRVVRGLLARNAKNLAATFVALVYQTAQTLLRQMQDTETTGGTPLWLNGSDGYGTAHLHRLANENSDCDLHTPSDGIVLF